MAQRPETQASVWEDIKCQLHQVQPETLQVCKRQEGLVQAKDPSQN